MNRAYTTMVVPAENAGWEVWESKKNGFEKTRSVEGGLEENGLDSGVCILLPVHALATLPLVVQSEDSELCKGATQLALEKSGLITEADKEAWDSTIVSKKNGVSLVAGHSLLEDLFDGGDDLKDVEFDYSPRCLEVGEADVIVCWIEHERWVLSCYQGGKPFYAEPLGAELDRSLLPAVRQLDSQLMIAGIDFNPEQLIFLSEVGAVRENEWSEALSIPVISRVRPNPKFLNEPLKIQTKGMIEWHRKRKAGSKNKLWFAAIAAVYLIAGGLIFWNFRKLNDKIDEQKAIIAKTSDVSTASNNHILKWEELDDLVKEKWPLEVYRKFCLMIPPNSSMRFNEVEIQEDDTIALKGYAPSLNSINGYVQKLKSSPSFSELKWDTPPPVENVKTKVWEFDFEALKAGEVF